MTTRPSTSTWPLPSEPPPLRLRDPAGVVAAVPYLLGFAPRRSLVVVGVDEDRGVGATLRTDLPGDELLGAAAGTYLPDVWGHAGDVLRRNGCTRALVVLYGDVDPAQLPLAAEARLLDVLDPLGRADLGDDLGDDPGDDPGDDDPLDVLDVLLVGPTRFRSLLCPDPTCCPADGSPVAAAGSHPVAASFVLAGRAVAPDRQALEPVSPPAAPAQAETASASTRRARGRRPSGAAGDAHDAALLEEWLACLPAGPDPALAGRLAAGWRDRALLRDACLAAFLPGGPGLARWLLAAGRPEHVLPGPAGPATPARPAARPPTSLAGCLADPGCARAVRGGAPVLRRMAALVPAPEQADVVAAHAWLAWASGEGTAAAVLAERALLVDEHQSLARLVLQCLQHGLGAPWTSARTTRPA